MPSKALPVERRLPGRPGRVGLQSVAPSPSLSEPSEQAGVPGRVDVVDVDVVGMDVDVVGVDVDVVDGEVVDVDEVDVDDVVEVDVVDDVVVDVDVVDDVVEVLEEELVLEVDVDGGVCSGCQSGARPGEMMGGVAPLPSGFMMRIPFHVKTILVPSGDHAG